MIEHPKFKPTTPITEIFEAFKNPVSGVPLLQPMPSFPSNTFSSFDAIVWVHNNSESNCDPLEILENMRKWAFKMIVIAKWIWTESFFYFLQKTLYLPCVRRFFCSSNSGFLPVSHCVSGSRLSSSSKRSRSIWKWMVRSWSSVAHYEANSINFTFIVSCHYPNDIIVNGKSPGRERCSRISARRYWKEKFGWQNLQTVASGDWFEQQEWSNRIWTRKISSSIYSRPCFWHLCAVGTRLRSHSKRIGKKISLIILNYTIKVNSKFLQVYSWTRKAQQCGFQLVSFIEICLNIFLFID